MFSRLTPESLARLDARRICIVKPSALGDVVQSLPLLPALKERFPHAAISWVIASGLADLLDDHPLLHEVIRYERKSTVRNWGRLLSTLHSRRFDLVFDLQGLLRTGVMTWATRAPVRIGLQTAREGSRFACHLLLPDTGRMTPAHARYWKVAEHLGVGELRPQTILAIPPAEQSWADRLLRPRRGPFLAVNPGARWITKRWPVEKFSAVAAQAARRFGMSVVLIGSRDEIPLTTAVAHALTRFAPNVRVVNLAGQTTLKQLAAVLQRVDLLLTNDSGPMHLAAGLGTPVVGLFTCTSPERSGPPGPQHELLSASVPCAASYRKTCPHSGTARHACFDDLDIERVLAAINRQVQKHLTRRGAA